MFAGWKYFRWKSTRSVREMDWSEAGVVKHGGEVQFLELCEPVRVVDGDSVYEAHPARVALGIAAFHG